MPRTQIGRPEFSDRLTLPRDGEAIDAGDVAAPDTTLLNNDLYLYGLIADQRREIEELKRLRGGLTLTAPASLQLEPGRSYSYPGAIGIGRVDGYKGNIDLAALDVPAGVTVAFDPDPAPGNSSALSIDVGSAAVAGTYNLTLSGTGPDGKMARTLLPVTVAAQTQRAEFNFSTAQSGSVDRANNQTSGTFIMVVQRQGNFSDPITFSVTNLPAGVTAQWSKNPVTGSAALEQMASVLTLTVGASVPAGTYNINIRAEGGGVVRSQAVTFGVSAAPLPTEPSFTLETVYDAGDPLVVNGATIYINRSGGYTGPVRLEVGGELTGPVILVNGQPWNAMVTGNTARITADGASRGWTNSGVTDVPPDYSGSRSYSFVTGTASIGGGTATRYSGLSWRWGNRTFGG